MVSDNSYLWRLAGKKALDYIDSDTVVLGAGRTILAAADVLLESGLYKGRFIVPATEGTKRYIDDLSKSMGLHPEIGKPEDLTPGSYTCFDGADEIVATKLFDKKAYSPALRADQDKMLIKGGDKGTGDPGKEGCMKKEWDLASNAGRFIVLADYTKLVPYLGKNFRVPLEFKEEMGAWLKKYLADCVNITDVLVRTYNGQPFVTENGNQIYDAKIDSRNFKDMRKLDKRLRAHAGMVSTGLFVDPSVIPDFAIIAPEHGVPFLYE